MVQGESEIRPLGLASFLPGRAEALREWQLCRPSEHAGGQGWIERASLDGSGTRRLTLGLDLPSGGCRAEVMELEHRGLDARRDVEDALGLDRCERRRDDIAAVEAEGVFNV